MGFSDIVWGNTFTCTYLTDVIRKPRTFKQEVHNAQLVINTLSQDVLNVSLSHIQGENIVNGDRETIGNLLEVFKGLLEYILDKIESDTSSVGMFTEKKLNFYLSEVQFYSFNSEK